MPKTVDEGAFLRPVERLSLSDRVFDRLSSAIIDGQFPAGTPLPSERKLCDSLGVNRGAVREALKRLEQCRLIAIQQGGATRVLDYRTTAGLDIIPHLLVNRRGAVEFEVARSLIELRASISPDIVRLATLRHGADLAPVLSPLLEETRSSSGDPLREQELSAEFWRIVVEASDNIAYALVFNTMNEVNERIKSSLKPLMNVYYQDVSGFEEMIEAIISSEPEQARRAADRHVSRIAEAVASEIRNLQTDGATGWQTMNPTK